jgi:hypothetical protein
MHPKLTPPEAVGPDGCGSAARGPERARPHQRRPCERHAGADRSVAARAPVLNGKCGQGQGRCCTGLISCLWSWLVVLPALKINAGITAP